MKQSPIAFTVPAGMPEHCPQCFSEHKRYLIKAKAWKCRNCGQVYKVRSYGKDRKRLIPINT